MLFFQAARGFTEIKAREITATIRENENTHPLGFETLSSGSVAANPELSFLRSSDPFSAWYRTLSQMIAIFLPTPSLQEGLVFGCERDRIHLRPWQSASQFNRERYRAEE